MSVESALPEWRRVQSALGASRSCQRDGYYADAVSRAYYAVLHAAKAMLAYNGFGVPNTHDGVSNRFGRHIARTGLIERHFASEIGRLYDLRNRADYVVDAVFGEADAQDAIARAEAFLNRLHTLLATAITTEELG